MYPWGDSHSLNLGWFLVQFKAWTEKIQEYLDNGGGTSENLANVIAPVFNAENSYLTGDYVLYNNELYKALEPVPAGTWNPDAWERCLVTEEMGSASSGVDNVARLMIAGQYSNTYNYQKYAICRYTDKLWMCNTNLPTGGEEWEPSHWDEITVGAGLTGLRLSVETLSNTIVELQNIVGDGLLSGFTATNLTDAANELKSATSDVAEDLADEIIARGNADTAIEKGLAIIVTGDTCPTAVPAGGYAYIKNNTHGLAEGLYRNKTATSFPTSGGTADSTVFESITNGGLNNLFEFVTTGTDTTLSCYAKFGNGLLICWGGIPTYHASNTSTSADIEFPVAFVGSYSLVLQAANNASGTYDNATLTFYNYTVNGFSARAINTSPGTPSGRYFAIGRWRW